MQPFCLTYLQCKKYGKMLPCCVSCENYYSCSESLGYPARITKTVNTVTNIFPDGSSEIIVYKNKFDVLVEQCNQPEVDRARKWAVNDGILVPKGDWITLNDYYQSTERSSRRSLDNFYGYGLSNEWQYFVTLTFDINRINRNSDDIVKDAWSRWLDTVKINNPNIKGLLVPERHKKGQLHFHGFLSNVNIILEQAYYPDTYKKVHLRGQPIKSKCGDFVFNIKDWDYGYSTCCILPPDTNKRKVVNYCLKYMNKDSNIGYNKKRYYRTRNLKFKEKYCSNLDIDYSNIEDYFSAQGYIKVDKKNEDIMIFRR